MTDARPNSETLALLAALRFAARKHRGQMRKDGATPYIEHPIAVTEVLARVAGVTTLPILQAALLHDVIEDTATAPEELDAEFGREVRSLVLELTDDKRLPVEQRRRLQVERAPGLSPDAKRIKIADKICNVGDITPHQPPGWSMERKLEYLAWAASVVAGCRGSCPRLEQHFESVLVEAKRRLKTTAGQP